MYEIFCCRFLLSDAIQFNSVHLNVPVAFTHLTIDTTATLLSFGLEITNST